MQKWVVQGIRSRHPAAHSCTNDKRVRSLKSRGRALALEGNACTMHGGGGVHDVFQLIDLWPRVQCGEGSRGGRWPGIGGVGVDGNGGWVVFLFILFKFFVEAGGGWGEGGVA